MKKFIIGLFLFISITSFSQVPDKFNYQGLLRNSSGDLVKNASITVKIYLLQGSSSGTIQYSENHSVSTNNYGQFNVFVGAGTLISGSYTTIDWSQLMFIKTEVANPAGGTFVDMGTVQLLSVPYALYAKNVENKDDADADPSNEIQDLNLTGNTLKITNNSGATAIDLAPYAGTNTDNQNLNLLGTELSITGGNMVNLVTIQDGYTDADADPTNELQAISISNDSIYLSNGGFVKLPIDLDISSANELQNLILTGDTLKISNGNQVVFPYDSSRWSVNGNKLFYNTGNIGIGSSDPTSKLEVKSTSTTGALFQVINANNDTVFAVYPDGVKVFVDSDSKGTVGGFAVSGRTPTKLGGKVEYFRVTPDSTRIYVNDSIGAKGKVGGFAVSGRTPTKGGTKDYFTVNKDSTRIYISDSISSKGKVGGFAVSGRTPTKQGDINDYFNISGNKKLESIESEARILWYPVKAAFLAGEVHIGSADSVGTNSTSLGYRTIAMGNYSQAMGYEAQSLGLNSTAIGNNAIANSSNSFAFGNYAQTQGLNSFAFGDSAISNGENSYALGSHANASGKNSFAMGSFGIDEYGSITGPTVASGDYSYAFGMSSQATGKLSFAFGSANIAAEDYSIAIGRGNKAQGNNSIAIGKGTTASAHNSFAFGLENTASGPSSFALGNYTVASGVFSTTLGNATRATGLCATALGFETTAIGDFSTTIGRKLWANGNHSIAIGSFSTADGASSLALGNYTYASGIFSTTIGNATTASGLNATAMGFSSIASGSFSTVIGSQVKANSYASLVVGMFNDTTSNSSTAWVSADPLFIIGNGLSDNARSNALTVLKDGRIGIGTKAPDKKLHVEGDARITGDIFYGASPSITKYTKPDYVFKPEYNSYLEPIKVEEFIKTNGHLPWITSAKDEKNGVNLTRMQFETLETVENLQLQIIELKKENQDIISKQQSEIELIREENNLLRKQINEIKSFLENLKK
ncbi:MAG: hypothetical protein A2W99_09450 [Bacteroidetes bacterium GWF2_33_16]|nr:MAG: hypothetical protein A2X00_06360 [Bacteroidetes bacterium GWE2_32_14]OFY07222.1 MAG: hypothetical protein A2W99_09450 [Bacteroidetes bacterium GWF2_33_16]